MILLIFVILLFLARSIEFYIFMKDVKTRCKRYDWKYVDENPELLLDILEKDYHLKCEWSAYKFLYFDGPSPLSIFFSLNILKIENIYNEMVIERLNRYENI